MRRTLLDIGRKGSSSICLLCQSNAASQRSLSQARKFSRIAPSSQNARSPVIQQDIPRPEHPLASLSREEHDELVIQEQREAYQQSVDDAYDHAEYVPAEDWNGLEIVGGEAEWDTGRIYQGYGPADQVTSAEDIKAAMHQAAINVVCNHSKGSQGEALRQRIENSSHGQRKSRLLFRTSMDGNQISIQWPHEASTDGQAESSVSSTQQQLPGLRLTNMPFKLALVQQFTQLSGIRVSDNIIQKSDTMETMLREILKKTQKPKNLHQQIAENVELTSLPNVRILNRRETPVDKEVRLGRWKVIREQLTARGLPVLGPQ